MQTYEYYSGIVTKIEPARDIGTLKREYATLEGETFFGLENREWGLAPSIFVVETKLGTTRVGDRLTLLIQIGEPDES